MRCPIAVILCLALFGGCAAPSAPRDIIVAPADYAAAFEAAKQALRHAQFDLERVDARAGVISTARRPAAGLAAPWEAQQTNVGQEFEDVIHNQQRRVRISFEPPGPVAGGAADPHDPAAGESIMYVRVILDRIYRPGWRLSTTAINLSTRATDPALVQRSMQPRYDVAYDEDRLLAARITRDIRKRMQRPSSEQ